jgi:hypothetical protein
VPCAKECFASFTCPRPCIANVAGNGEAKERKPTLPSAGAFPASPTWVLWFGQQTIKHFTASDRLRVFGTLDLDPRQRVRAGLGLADDPSRSCSHASSKNRAPSPSKCSTHHGTHDAWPAAKGCLRNCPARRSAREAFSFSNRGTRESRAKEFWKGCLGALCAQRVGRGRDGVMRRQLLRGRQRRPQLGKPELLPRHQAEQLRKRRHVGARNDNAGAVLHPRSVARVHWRAERSGDWRVTQHLANVVSLVVDLPDPYDD